MDQLEAARLALEKCREQGVALASSMSDSRWLARPAGGGWSASDCYAHLNLTLSAMLPLLEKGVQEARAQQWAARGSLGVGLMPAILRWMLEPPYRIKTATKPAFVPKEAAGKAEVMHAWEEKHSAMDLLIRGGAGLALDRPMIVSPFDPKGRVRYSVYAALLILGAHERRHLWQAKRAAK